MGQGHYVALAFGAPGFEPKGLSEKAEEDFCDAVYDNDARTSYECDRPYVGIRIADSASVGDLDLGEVIGGCIAIGELAAKVNKHPAVLAAEKQWAKVRKAAAKAGVDLPAGELFLLADYD